MAVDVHIDASKIEESPMSFRRNIYDIRCNPWKCENCSANIDMEERKNKDEDRKQSTSNQYGPTRIYS